MSKRERSWDDKDDERDNRRSLGTLVRNNMFDVVKDVGDTQFSNVLSLSDEQALAEKKILRWLEEYKLSPVTTKKLFTLGGYAGTGKTTLLGVLARALSGKYNVAFCTLTGKASSVLARSLAANGISPAYCGTIHRLMYDAIVDEKTGEVLGWDKKVAVEYDAIIVDEASMLSSELLDDMLKLGKPILAVGDHGQLPPVGEDVGIMESPDARLEEVRRQAMDNPVIALSVLVRKGGNWKSFIKASGDPRVQWIDPFDINAVVMDRFKGFQNRPMSEDPLVLCGRNKTRKSLNKAARIGVNELLVENDRVICLRNAYLGNMLLANGFRGKVQGFGYAPNPLHLNLRVSFPDEGLELVNGLACKAQFGQEATFKSFLEINQFMRNWHEAGLLFDYGSALTVHKAQGSQQDDVILQVERMQGNEEEFLRWVYTGLTRASRTVSVSF